jgi:hypothetical protein
MVHEIYAVSNFEVVAPYTLHIKLRRRRRSRTMEKNINLSKSFANQHRAEK